MGIWNFYFFAKLYMYWSEVIDFHFWVNILFAVFVLVPLARPILHRLRTVMAVPMGAALLYYDSWLPPFSRLIAQRDFVSQFSAKYLLDVATRFINIQLVLTLIVFAFIYWLFNRRLRMTTFALLALVIVPVAMQLGKNVTPVNPAVAAASVGGAPSASEAAPVLTTLMAESDDQLSSRLKAFYAQQAGRKISFANPKDGEEAFDVLVLHVCSLAWDDLEYVGLRNPPLMSRFDLRFDNFSAGASYSGPAAVRMLRSGCGHTPHSQLYKAADRECYLFGDLKTAGYRTQFLMNHDGRFGNFASVVRDAGGLDAEPQDNTGAPVVQRMFDGAPLRGDYDVLSQWWQQRLNDPSKRVALYYNTASLHDGNDVEGVSLNGPQESYRYRATQFFSNLERFFDVLEGSGRKVVVMLVPEHGAAVRGDKTQISGMREIPSPSIAIVPVGVRLVGLPASKRSAPIINTAPKAHFALSELLSGFVAASPYQESAPALVDYVGKLSDTDFIAENEATVVLKTAGHFKMLSPDGQWSDYRE